MFYLAVDETDNSASYEEDITTPWKLTARADYSTELANFIMRIERTFNYDKTISSIKELLPVDEKTTQIEFNVCCSPRHRRLEELEVILQCYESLLTRKLLDVIRRGLLETAQRMCQKNA